MTTIFATAQDALAGLLDPFGRKLGAPAFASFLERKPTSVALEARASDIDLRVEIHGRDEKRRADLHARQLAAAVRAIDMGDRPPAPEDDIEKEPENKEYIAWLEAQAKALGLRGRDQIMPHLHARDVVLTAHLAARYQSEGEPEGLRELRVAHSKATAAAWQAQSDVLVAQRHYREHGGCLGIESEAPIHEAIKVSNQRHAEREALRAKLHRDWAVTV